jgi:hypothetical protein
VGDRGQHPIPIAGLSSPQRRNHHEAKPTPQEARNLQLRLEEIAAEIKAAAESLLTGADRAADDKKADKSTQEQATHEPEKK